MNQSIIWRGPQEAVRPTTGSGRKNSMDTHTKERIVNSLRTALQIKNCGNQLVIIKALTMFELNRPVAKEIAQTALADAFSSDNAGILTRALSNEDREICLSLISELKEQENRAAAARSVYVPLW